MQYSVLDYLEKSAEKFPQKCAVKDDKKSISYGELMHLSKSVGTALSNYINKGDSVCVYMEKSADALVMFLGIVYAGGFYTMLNTELPQIRLKIITEVLRPKVILTNRYLKNAAEEFFGGKIICCEDIFDTEICENTLAKIRRQMIDTDLLYVNFTSGSTGTPKGIAVSHHSVIDFIDFFTQLFEISNSDIIANQAPFDFDVSVKDIYSSLKTGATLVIVPRELFSAPAKLMDYICENNVTTMIWAVSALCLISAFHALEYKTPQTVNKILFSGEVMPFKHLQNLRKFMPNAKYVNLYGPTEITCNCTYHILDKNKTYEEGIPIGIPFPNEDVFLLSEDNKKVVQEGEKGEICIRGTALALGYFNSPEQNNMRFVQNPLNQSYPEKIYKTGDLGCYNSDGELVFKGRKDFQIKYMGHRIELEEIEKAIGAVGGIERCCCIFDEKKLRLKGFYVGNIEKDELYNSLKETLPAYMIPGILRKIDKMPLNQNGKIDRKILKET